MSKNKKIKVTKIVRVQNLKELKSIKPRMVACMFQHHFHLFSSTSKNIHHFLDINLQSKHQDHHLQQSFEEALILLQTPVKKNQKKCYKIIIIFRNTHSFIHNLFRKTGYYFQ